MPVGLKTEIFPSGDWRLCVVVLSILMQQKQFFFPLNLSSSWHSHIWVHSLPKNSWKRLAPGVLDASAIYADLVYGVTDTDCQTKMAVIRDAFLPLLN